MLQDVRFALRSFTRHPAFAAVAILTVALGVGVNTAVFSIADSVLFRPLPFPDADRMFVLRIGNPRTGETSGMLPGADVDAARAAGLFDSVGATSGFGERVYLRHGDGLDALLLVAVSPEYVDMLGLRPIAGRAFDRSDVGTRAVLLAYRTWMRQYGGDPAIVGATLPTLARSTDDATEKAPMHVVGVLPPTIRVPLFTTGDGMMLMPEEAGGAGRTFPPLVRLKRGVTPAAAQAQMSALRGPELVPGKSELRLVSLREQLGVREDHLVWLLVGAAAIVLLVACANLANLILARGSARARELAVRAALGGSRRRLIRLLFTEGACIATIGTAAGVFFGYVAFLTLAHRLPPRLAIAARPAFDMRVLGFAIAIACASTVAFSVLPAIRLARADALGGLGLGRLQTTSPRRGRRLLVGAEVAICLALLVGAGLVGRTLYALVTQDMGFGPHRVWATFDLPTMPIRRATAQADQAARLAFMKARLDDVRAVPGVRSAAIASAGPFSGMAPDFALTDGRGADRVYGYNVASGYIKTLGMSLLAGRDMTDAESDAGGPVGVLNERAARMLCGTPRDCIGHVVQSPRQPPRTVVGVVRDARQSMLKKSPPAMYVPFDPAFIGLGSIIVDIDDTPAARERLTQVLATAKDARVEIRPLDDSRDVELSPFRFNAIVVGAFAMLTLALAVVGVYGVMTAVVAERTREYGVRIALGATSARLNRFVLGQAAVPLVGGVIGGLVLALWASRFVASLLYGVVPADGVSFAAAAAIVLTSGLLAAFVPARRAGRVDPIVALRAE
jgi:putative ABC transport system permease protein